MNKIDQIKDAIERANNLQSKMDDIAWSVPALSSLRIRHLMNNLGAISTRYMEHGTHKGGIFCSVLRNNPNIEIAWWGDSFESDKITGENVEGQFLQNAINCIQGTGTSLLGEVANTFDLPGNFGDSVDLYCFDADHSYESQRKAVTYFLRSMANEFIMCIDDMDFPEVAAGTKDGLAEAPVEVLFEQVFKGNDHDNMGWWNGYGIWLLKKK